MDDRTTVSKRVDGVWTDLYSKEGIVLFDLQILRHLGDYYKEKERKEKELLEWENE